jgi:enterochelin esterase-like enzyme
MLRVSAALLLVLPVMAFSQKKPVPPKPEPPIISPEVHRDRSITFRLKMPAAHLVTVGVEGQNKNGKQREFAMTKGKDGVWSYTIKPLAPAYYGYWFTADKQLVLDPQSPWRRPNIIYQSNMVLVPGNPPEVWETQSVPHGEVHHHFFKSSIIGAQQDYYVYTPPNYPKGGPYPVLYLLHGYSDFADGWFSVGMANVILDNLIAQHKAKPMLLVAPLMYGAPITTSGNPPVNDEHFRASLFNEIMPAVESDYKAIHGSQAAAIAGLSYGANDALETALNNLGRFAYAGGFSAGGVSDDSYPGIDGTKVNATMKLIWLSWGTSDSFASESEPWKKWFGEKGIKYEEVLMPGTHEWPIWRKNLIEFAKQIFR